jgi:hypothetical protein
VRLHQRHWPESSTEEQPLSARRHRWASTSNSEWQSTRASGVDQDRVVLRPVGVGESTFRDDSNLCAVERQWPERCRFSSKQDSSSRLGALGLPAWVIAPATSRGSASDDDTGGGDESLPVRLSYAQRFNADDDDDESEDEDYDYHELEPESKRQPPVSALWRTKARAKWSGTIVASAGVVVLGSGKWKQAAGQRNNGDAGSSKRPKKTPCRFDGGCDYLVRSNGLCMTHGCGKRCQHAGGCGKSAEIPTSFCVAHGGGKRCQYADGCGKGAISPTSNCIAHGGGKRCQHAGGCGKSARSASSYCAAHGEGKRCQHAGGCRQSAKGST